MQHRLPSTCRRHVFEVFCWLGFSNQGKTELHVKARARTATCAEACALLQFSIWIIRRFSFSVKYLQKSKVPPGSKRFHSISKACKSKFTLDESRSNVGIPLAWRTFFRGAVFGCELLTLGFWNYCGLYARVLFAGRIGHFDNYLCSNKDMDRC